MNLVMQLLCEFFLSLCKFKIVSLCLAPYCNVHMSSVNSIIAFRKWLAVCSVQKYMVLYNVSLLQNQNSEKKIHIPQKKCLKSDHCILHQGKAEHHSMCELAEWHGPFGKAKQLCFLPNMRGFLNCWSL